MVWKRFVSSHESKELAMFLHLGLAKRSENKVARDQPKNAKTSIVLSKG